MRALAFLSILLAAAPSSCPVQGDTATKSETVLPAGEHADEACRGAVQGVAERWQERYGIRDYRIFYLCENEPPNAAGEMALGRMKVEHNERFILLWVNSNRAFKEVEEVVAHELLHAVVDIIRNCNSPLVEEQHIRRIARALTESQPRPILKVAPNPITAER